MLVRGKWQTGLGQHGCGSGFFWEEAQGAERPSVWGGSTVRVRLLELGVSWGQGLLAVALGLPSLGSIRKWNGDLETGGNVRR